MSEGAVKHLTESDLDQAEAHARHALAVYDDPLAPKKELWVQEAWGDLAMVRFTSSVDDLPEFVLALVAMARQAPRWIPVEERMPEDGANIVAWDAAKGIRWVLRAFPSAGDSGWIAGTTHWMPLPEPPEETPILGRAEPAPSVPGRVSFAIERIVPAADLDAIRGRRHHLLCGHLAEMMHLLAGSLEEPKIGSHDYRIRISVEPESR